MALGYEGVGNFADVELSAGAFVEASGAPSSAVSVQARTLRILPGARIYALNSGAQPGGNININASESVEAIGTGDLARDTLVMQKTNFSNVFELPTGLFSVTSGTGASGNVEINAARFSAVNSAVIGTYTSGAGRGGDVRVNASQSVDISASRLETYTVLNSLGAGGNLNINTPRLNVKAVGIVSASTSGAGQGGNLTVNASDFVELLGANILVIRQNEGVPLLFNTALFVATVGDGDAGELRLATKGLSVRDGGFIAVSSVGTGEPGNAIITATESIEFQGITADTLAFPSRLTAVASPFAIETRGGNISIATGKLILRDGAIISVSNTSPGNGGSLAVIADSILLDDRARIIAETAFGAGGNISLRSRSVQLRNNSTISVTAGGTQDPLELPPELAAFYAARATGAGDGGNILINTDTLAALENSTIAANAQEGRGGRVSITAQGIFLSPDSQITATSALGAEFSGVVNLQTPDFASKSALLNLPSKPADPNQQILSGCEASSGSTFTVTGRGGLPEDPVSVLSVPTVWRDTRDFSEIESSPNDRTWQQPAGFGAFMAANPPLQEATGWIVRADGQVELIADAAVANSWQALTSCSWR